MSFIRQRLGSPPRAFRHLSFTASQRVVQVDQHDHAGLRRHAGQRDEADRHGHRSGYIPAHHISQIAADQREGDRASMTISVSVTPAEIEVQQDRKIE
jgi:hypothetical protein